MIFQYGSLRVEEMETKDKWQILVSMGGGKARIFHAVPAEG